MKITVDEKEIEIKIESLWVKSNSKDEIIQIRFNVVPSRKFTEYEEQKFVEMLHKIVREAG